MQCQAIRKNEAHDRAGCAQYTPLADVPGGRKAKAVQGIPEMMSVEQRENFLPNLFMDK
jgi:hypothetical protein